MCVSVENHAEFSPLSSLPLLALLRFHFSFTRRRVAAITTYAAFILASSILGAGRRNDDATDAYVRKIPLKHAKPFSASRRARRLRPTFRAQHFVTRMTPASRYPIVSARAVDKSYVGD